MIKRNKKRRNNEYGATGGKRNYACITCRKTARGPVHEWRDPLPICPSCRKPMSAQGCKLRLPKKNNIKAWKKIKD